MIDSLNNNNGHEFKAAPTFGAPIIANQLADLIVDESFFEDDIFSHRQYRVLKQRFSPGMATRMLDSLSGHPNITGVQSTIMKQKRGEVKGYMLDQNTRERMGRLGNFLADVTKISDQVILPQTDEELACLGLHTIEAMASNRPLTISTPVCPDWSRDFEGRYDFKSLGDGESFIAKKLFAGIPELLNIFNKHGIPYKGFVIFADWGLETEIDAKGTFGEKLSADEIRKRFQQSFDATKAHLEALKQAPLTAAVFGPYEIVSMTEYFAASGRDIPEIEGSLRGFFQQDSQGKRLADQLNSASLSLNQERLGVNEVENKAMILQTLVEYGTLGQVVDNHGIIAACESTTSSRAYNLPRGKYDKVPLFYIKGKDPVDRGVNIL